MMVAKLLIKLSVYEQNIMTARNKTVPICNLTYTVKHKEIFYDTTESKCFVIGKSTSVVQYLFNKKNLLSPPNLEKSEHLDAKSTANSLQLTSTGYQLE